MRTIKSKTQRAAERRAAYVAGVVEEAMRALLAVDAAPTIGAVQSLLPSIGWHSIKRARRALVDSGVVELRCGLTPYTTLPAEKLREAFRALARVEADEPGTVATVVAVSPTRLTALGVGGDPPPPGRRRHRFRGDVVATFRRERSIREWSARRKEAGRGDR